MTFIVAFLTALIVALMVPLVMPVPRSPGGHGRLGAPTVCIRAEDQSEEDLFGCERSHFRAG